MEDDDNRFEVGLLGAEVRRGATSDDEIRARLYEIERRILLIEEPTRRDIPEDALGVDMVPIRSSVEEAAEKPSA